VNTEVFFTLDSLYIFIHLPEVALAKHHACDVGKITMIFHSASHHPEIFIEKVCTALATILATIVDDHHTNNLSSIR
jgi:hypothetical protein